MQALYQTFAIEPGNPTCLSRSKPAAAGPVQSTQVARRGRLDRTSCGSNWRSQQCGPTRRIHRGNGRHNSDRNISDGPSTSFGYSASWTLYIGALPQPYRSGPAGDKRDLFFVQQMRGTAGLPNNQTMTFQKASATTAQLRHRGRMEFSGAQVDSRVRLRGPPIV